MPPKKVTSDDKGCNVPEVDFLFAICMIFVIVASASGCEDIRLHGSEAAEGRSEHSSSRVSLYERSFMKLEGTIC